MENDEALRDADAMSVDDGDREGQDYDLSVNGDTNANFGAEDQQTEDRQSLVSSLGEIELELSDEWEATWQEIDTHVAELYEMTKKTERNRETKRDALKDSLKTARKIAEARIDKASAQVGQTGEVVKVLVRNNVTTVNRANKILENYKRFESCLSMIAVASRMTSEEVIDNVALIARQLDRIRSLENNFNLSFDDIEEQMCEMQLKLKMAKQNVTEKDKECIDLAKQIGALEEKVLRYESNGFDLQDKRSRRDRQRLKKQVMQGIEKGNSIVVDDSDDDVVQGSLRSGSTRSRQRSEATNRRKSLSSESTTSFVAGDSSVIDKFLANQLKLAQMQSLPKLKKFSGEGNKKLNDFVSSFNKRFPSEIFDDETRAELFTEQLEGLALAHVNSFSADVKRSFNRINYALSEKLKSAGTITAMAALAKLDKLVYTGNSADSLNKFCVELDSLMSKAHPDMNDSQFSLGKANILLRQFAGKPHELRELNHKLELADKGDEYRTIRDAALSWARVRDRFGANESSTMTAKKKFGFTGGKALSRASSNSNEGTEKVEASASTNLATEKQNFERSKLSCYHCHEKGHIARKCPRKTEQPQASTSTASSSAGKAKNGFGALSIRLSPVINSICADKPVKVSRFGGRTEKPVMVLGKQYQALLDTGAQISTMSSDILLDAKNRGVDITEAVKDCDPSELASDRKLVSYCHTELEFSRVATVEVEMVENRAKALVPVYFDDRTSGEVLLGTNVLGALGVKLSLDEKLHDEANPKMVVELDKEKLSVCGEAVVATVQKRVVIKPGHSKTVSISAPESSIDESPVLWTCNEENRIASGVLSVESGYSDVVVCNSTDSDMIFSCGDTLGSWDTECIVHKVDPMRLNELQLLDVNGTKRSVISNKDRERMLMETLEEVRNGKVVSKLPDVIEKLIRKFADVFALEDCELTQTDIVEVDIDTGEAKPIRQKARRVPYGARSQLKEILDGLLEKGVIARSSSEWASPIVLVEKKDKSLRLCVDYRELNKVMRHDAYPLPMIDQILQSLSGKSCFSTLDLHSGFWQLPLSSSAQEKSAFTTSEGLFEFKVVPFGLSTSPAVFQRTMETVLKDVNGYGDEVVVYVDDILIATSTEERHAIVLESVLESFRRANLKLKAQKCSIMLSQVEYLGHVVNVEGIQTDPDKVKSIKEFPTPTNPTELRRFLGLCNYYRKFVLRYGTVAKPLNELTGKKEWKWDGLCEIAFDKLKDALSKAPVLGQPNVALASTGEKPFFIYTDASRSGVGAVLCQEGGDGFLHPIYFASKSLSKAQKNYSITDLEALAVVFACEKFHYFIFGMKVVVRSDHQPLLALFKRTDVSPRVMRWAIQLMTYSGLSMEYVKGKVNVVADALSRGLAVVPGQEGVKETEEKVIAVVSACEESEWLKELKNDPNFAQLITYIENGNLEVKLKLPKVAKAFFARDFVIDNGYLCYIASDGSYKKVVPVSKRKLLFMEQHNKAHFSPGKISKILQRELYWNGLVSDVAAWHKECVVCYVNNVKPAVPPLQPILTQNPYELVAIDLMDLGVTENGNRYVVTIIDHFSKFANAYPVSDKSAKTVAQTIVHLWMCQGARWPKQFLSDQGSEFVNSVVEEIVSLTGCKWLTTKGYNSRENGLVERVQRTLQNALKKCVNSPTNWDMVLPFVVYAYNTTCHESTGESPYFLLHGTDPPLISDVAPPRELTLALVDSDDYRAHLIESVRIAREFAKERNAREAEQMKKHYDERRRATKEKLSQPGGRVFVYMPQEKSHARNPKLVQEFRGPFRVLESSDTSALVTLIGGNEEPIRIQHDFLLKVPDCMENPNLETKTKRKNRANRKKAQNVNVSKPKIVINSISCLRVELTKPKKRSSGELWAPEAHMLTGHNDEIYRLSGSLLDGRSCADCGLGTYKVGELMRVIPDAPALPPLIANKKVSNILELAWISTVVTNDCTIAEKLSALNSPEEDKKLTAKGLAMAWFLATTACFHVMEAEKKMRSGTLCFTRKGVLGRFLPVEDLEAAWLMVPSVETMFQLDQEKQRSHMEAERRGNIILLPLEMGCYNSRTIRWRKRTLVVNYTTIDYLGEVADHFKNLEVDSVVLVPPMRAPRQNQLVDLQSLVELAQKSGARFVVVTPPMFTEVGWSSWRAMLPKVVEDQNRRLKFLHVSIRCQFYDVKEEYPSVKSPFGCAGADPLRGKAVLEAPLLERFLRNLGAIMPSLSSLEDRKRSMNPNMSSEKKRRMESRGSIAVDYNVAGRGQSSSSTEDQRYGYVLQ